MSLSSASVPVAPLVAETLPWVLGGLLLYWLALLWLPSRWYQKLENLSDYFLAGQKLTVFPIALSFMASWFGASSMKGSLEAYLSDGLSAIWLLAIPSLLSTVIIAAFLAERVAKQPELSQPEAMETHYGSGARLGLSVVIIVATTTYLASQSIAAGQLLGGLLGWPMELATALVFGGVVIYSALGGYAAVVMTDMAQVLLIGAGLLLLLGQALGFHVSNGFTGLANAAPDFWNVLPADPWNAGALALSFALGWCIAPEMWQRMRSAPTPKTAKRSAWLGVSILWVFLGIALAVGLLGPGVLSSVNAEGQGLLGLSLALPHPVLSSVVILALLAAVSSSMDSSLNVGSFVLTHDVAQRYFLPKASSRQLLFISRLATVLMALPAYFIATRFQDIIHVLWLSADVYACSMFWPIIGLLFDREASLNPRRGLWAMVAGGSVAGLTAGVQYGVLPWSAWYPQGGWATLMGVALSGLAYWLSRNTQPADTSQPCTAC